MSLLIQYRLDEDLANIGVDSIGSLDMTNTTVTSAVDATYGNCAYFDGSSFLTLPSASVPATMLGNANRTFCCWVKITEGTIHCNGSTATQLGYRADYSTGGVMNIHFGLNNTAGSAVTTPDTWFHYASTYNGTDSFLYQNGVLDNSTGKGFVDTDSGDFSIGQDTFDTEPNLTGYVLDFRVYDGLLTATELLAITEAGPLETSHVLTYGFNSISTLNTDSVGTFDSTVNNGTAQLTNVGAVEEYGFTAHFDGATDYVMSTVPTTLSDNSARSFSVWIYSTVSGTDQKILSTAGGTGVHIIQKRVDNTIGLQSASFATKSTSTISSNTWYHVAFTYNGSNTTKVYINGALEETGTWAMDLSTIDMKYIGGRDGIHYFEGNMLDFRVYDSELDSTTMATIYSDGPIFIPITLTVTMYSHAANVTWPAVSGASTYDLIAKDSSGETFVTISGITGLEAIVYDLNDGETYDFEIYSDLDTVTSVYQSVLNLTPAVDSTETSNILTFISNDLTLVDKDTVSELDQYLKDNLSTGDTLQARLSSQNSILQDKTLTFVQELGTISISNSPTILTPFVSGDTSSNVTLELDDLTTEDVSFDESLNTVTVQSNTYSIGETFILDGKKVIVSELN